jgi:dienelactone hydrolase
MNIDVRFQKSVALTLLAFIVVATSSATATEPRRFFQADGSDSATYTLPDPLVDQAGRKIATAAEWEKTRRPEVLELFREHVYGRVPTTPYRQTFTVVNENPRAMDGAATLKQIAIKIEATGEKADRGKSVTINLSLFIPNASRQPAPAFLLICNRPVDNIDPTRAKKSAFWPAEEGIARGYAMAAFFNGDVAPDKKDAQDSGAQKLLNRGAPAPDAWGTLAAWAWGASRCLDYLQTDPAIAKEQVAVIGHSRGGKTALWAGAEDQRFALVCSNDSGCGGAALTRRKTGKKETLPVINRAFPHWFDANFKTYNDREAELPVDQHMLIALIAPRAVAVHSAEQDLWADPRGEFLSVVNARPVFQLYGKDDLGDSPQMPAIDEPLDGDGAQYHIREGKHDLTLVDWKSYWDFADRVLGRTK